MPVTTRRNPNVVNLSVCIKDKLKLTIIESPEIAIALIKYNTVRNIITPTVIYNIL
jgi:hypothetical protein